MRGEGGAPGTGSCCSGGAGEEAPALWSVEDKLATVRPSVLRFLSLGLGNAFGKRATGKLTVSGYPLSRAGPTEEQCVAVLRTKRWARGSVHERERAQSRPVKGAIFVSAVLLLLLLSCSLLCCTRLINPFAKEAEGTRERPRRPVHWGRSLAAYSSIQLSCRTTPPVAPSTTSVRPVPPRWSIGSSCLAE